MTTTPLQNAAARVRAALRAASDGLVEREHVVELIALAAVAQEHVLVIGPPGTAKSEAVRRVASAIDGQWFEYLLGRFTEPSEIFGPIDLKRLREGEVETRTSGMLPEAEIAFLDEVFLGSTAILNSLLGLLNERRYRRGHTVMECPLRVCVGASNALPDDPALAAFADRFLVRVFVEPLADPRIEDLLMAGNRLNKARIEPLASVADLDILTAAAQQLSLDPIVEPLAHAIRLLRKVGIGLSDRRIVKAQRLVAAAAALDGRAAVSEVDLWPIVSVIPTAPGQEAGRDTLRDMLAPAQSTALNAAAEDASHGPAARARRLTEQAESLLVATPGEDPNLQERWTLRLEGILREIDAGFAPQHRPAELDGLRARLVAAISGSA